ncbi:PqqD family protein [Herbivorax sp. ANBcel31]|uniref:PqqD family protein n=1 Tax=Herbivorax sp. ANBcel31 TaxID=3069754 RepID=UPI0027B63AD2|nr:PqqD family protein [Herbivorax sp. ANBcel31]MDQ2087365.1 PqqD family protein [Herbivorax sp. ANBcel31]
MKIKSGYIIREISDNHVVVPTGQATVDFNGMITLNETGAFLWKELTKGKKLDQLAVDFMKEYDVDQTTAKNDIKEFVERLKDADLIDQ